MYLAIQKNKTSSIKISDDFSNQNPLDSPTIEENISDIDEKFQGRFTLSVDVEATTTGMSSITYYFAISNEGILLVENTYHAPIRCIGKYWGTEKNNLLEIYYNDE